MKPFEMYALLILFFMTLFIAVIAGQLSYIVDFLRLIADALQ